MKHFNANPEHNASTCILAFDISRDTLNGFTRIASREHDFEFANSIPKARSALAEYKVVELHCETGFPAARGAKLNGLCFCLLLQARLGE